MSMSKPPATPAELAGLLRQARKSVSLDYIKWWVKPGTETPKGFEKQGRVVTMHDATPARLSALPPSVLDCRLIALEFTIDFVGKGASGSTQRIEADAQLFRTLVMRLYPWNSTHVAASFGRSRGAADYTSLGRPEVRLSPSGIPVMRAQTPQTIAERKLLLESCVQSGTIYFGPDNRAATSQPGSAPMTQVKVYRKLVDQGKDLPPEKQRIRLEVTCNAGALEAVLGGPLTVRKLPDLRYRDLVNTYFRLGAPQPIPQPKQTKKSPINSALNALLTDRRQALQQEDARAAETGGNFIAADDGGIKIKSIAQATRVLQEQADNLQRKLQSVRKSWDLRPLAP